MGGLGDESPLGSPAVVEDGEDVMGYTLLLDLQPTHLRIIRSELRI